MSNEIQSFDQFETIRKHIDDQNVTWYVVVDVINAVAQPKNPNNYWTDMKRRDKGGELLANCQKFSILNPKNGRRYQMECAEQEGILHIVQLIPSPNAEPFRRWLAITGSRRLDDIRKDPIEWRKDQLRMAGYNEKEIRAILAGEEVNRQLKTEWDQRGVMVDQQPTLSDEIHKGTFDGLTAQDHADLKSLNPEEELRMHMEPMELAMLITGEAATIDEIKETDAQGFDENKLAAEKGGETGGKMRKTYEEITGRKVISQKSPIKERKSLEMKKDDEETE